MTKQKISLKHKNGNVDGIYINAGSGSPLIIIVNGHNGFYNYGMFPYIQEQLFRDGISTYSFNFSHGGVIGDADFFDDLEAYEKNCMRLETEDLLCVLHNLDKFGSHSKISLLAHSLGGVPTVFGAKKAQDEKINLAGIILVSSVKTLRIWGQTLLDKWATDRVCYMKNNRTKQELPHGNELLQEVLSSETTWSVEREIKNIKCPILIIHGEKDEAVPVEHGESLYKWAKETNTNSTFIIIPNATHTYNTKHPFEGASTELEVLIKTVSEWVKKV